jgi:coenzyme F420-reducing hydrogenase gamma subunit
LCSGCYEQAYHVLNFMKTIMTKDLVYIGKQTLLIGYTPKIPENYKNVLLFGNCAVKSTRKYDFRTLSITKQKSKLLEPLKKIITRKKEKNPTRRIIKKQNRNILNLPGCPPDRKQIYTALLDYYTKKDAPNLHFYLESLKILNKNLKRGG